MIAREYIDEVKLRLPRTFVIKYLSDPLILSYINKARRDVQRYLMAIKPERYGKIVSIEVEEGDAVDSLALSSTYNDYQSTIYAIEMPTDFIIPYIVHLSYLNSDGVTRLSECRQVPKREMYNVQKHSWVAPRKHNPIYAVERKQENELGNTGEFLYLGGFDSGAAATIFDDYTINAIVWYVAALDDLTLSQSGGSYDDDVTTPLDVEELVIMFAMVSCLQNIGTQLSPQSVKLYLEFTKNLIKSNFELHGIETTTLLPSQDAIME